MAARRALIFGVTGQDGAWLSALLLRKGYEVFGTARSARTSNLAALGIADKVRTTRVDVSDGGAVRDIMNSVQPAEIYHLAAQSSVGRSFEDPVASVRDIVMGTVQILEAIRETNTAIRAFFAGSGDVYGDTGDKPATETTPFNPQSPYAVGKASAQLAVKMYRDAYSLHASTGILFPHESLLRDERFVTKKIFSAVAQIAEGSKERLRLGNLAIERDWGWAPEYVEAMWLMLQQPAPEDFVLATGQSMPLERFVSLSFEIAGLNWRDHVDIDQSLFRASDPGRSRADPAKAARVLNWRAKTAGRELIAKLAANR